jgi:rhodanese-related sulfurtransferase
MVRASLAFFFAATLLFTPFVANAAPKPTDPKKQTAWDLYLTAQEAYEMKMLEGDDILLVDARDPIEIMFTGYTDLIDVNVPIMLVNPRKWNVAWGGFAMEPNPHFATGVLGALKVRGLTKSTPVVLMCGSGGAPAAKTLEGLGLEAVYVVVDGFEGTTDRDNPNGPWRTIDGWKNSGLPWSYKLNPKKVYIREIE